MRTHELKSWPEYFTMVMSDLKLFELRKNDRDFRVGDLVVLEEFRPGVGTYTGRQQEIEITYIIRDDDMVAVDGLTSGYCIFGFKKV